MKYLITETQLKTLRKYMKTFINESDVPDWYIQGDRDPNAPWNQSDEPSEEVIVTFNGKEIAIIQIDNNQFDINFYINNETIKDNINNKLDELYNDGMLDSLSDDTTIEYKDLMSL
jgi:hypothetical protein